MRYILSSLLVLSATILLTYDEFDETKTPQAEAWKHSIILDMNKSSDKRLAETLKFSAYTCMKLNLSDFVSCSIKNSFFESQSYPTTKHYRLTTSVSLIGGSLKIYHNQDGTAHLKVFHQNGGIHRLYSFTSTSNLILYGNMYQNEILPKGQGPLLFNAL